ncbi:MAG: prolyl oligopeptidase family serine peptidase [Pseudomonadota bacterium]
MLERSTIAALLFFLSASASAQDLPPIEAYGALPEVTLTALSPSGNVVAYRVWNESQDVVVVVNLQQHELVTAVDVSQVNPRRLTLISDDQLLLVASNLGRSAFVRGRWENSAVWLLDTGESTLRRLFDRYDGIYAAQSGLGRIVGVSADGSRVFIPAYAETNSDTPPYSLFQAGTKRSSDKQIKRGNFSTRDWFVDANGEPLVREDMNQKKDLYRVIYYNGKDETLIYESEVSRPDINVIGPSADYQRLYFSDTPRGADAVQVFAMQLSDGTVEGPVIGTDGRSIRRYLTTPNRVLVGVEFDGFFPTYKFLDEGLNERVRQIQLAMPGASAQLVSWSADFRKLIFHVSSEWTAGSFLLFEEGQAKPSVLAHQRESIAAEHIGNVAVVEYEARDGLTIPALVTAKSSVREKGNAALIVMPHGGPQAYDVAAFDWLAQFFASRGYVVLQPQFRGSDGFGHGFARAGRGEWGKKMQTDLDDGVAYLAENGLIDPDRVCIVGASYGGYAALMAAVSSPGVYKCHVSINGVSDLRALVNYVSRRQGSNHWAVEYWEGQYGTTREDKETLEVLSPAENADKFESPVLLIHGRDDTVVPINHSKWMNKALRKADKPVSFVQLKGEDHYLSNAETRLETLRLIAEFIDQNL